MPSAFKKDRTSRNKAKKVVVNMTKKEDFKFKLSTTVVFNVQQLFQIQQDCSFLTKTSTKANMANLKILQQSLFGKKKIPYQCSNVLFPHFKFHQRLSQLRHHRYTTEIK